ncbi:hypothetical protein AB6A40_005760 [Gnathostoma spinigerum]|uniref:Uncharacterized protein n=1 Tax=Gnathostoma spinigerum TaxID=75299 RepID=A0ABD6EIH1_9BILA
MRAELTSAACIPPEQPPYWYSKANQTHSSWQNVADRQMTQETRQQQQSEVNASYATQNDYHRPSERAQSPTLARSENAIALPYQSISSQQTYERQQQQQQQEQQTSRSNHVEYAANALDGSASRENRYIPVGAPQLGIKSSEQGVVEEQYNRSQSQQRSYETTYKDSSMIKPYSSQFYQYDSSSRQQNQAVTSSSRAPGPEFSAKAEMAEVLPNGSLANTHAHTEGSYRDREGNNVNYKRELLTSVDPSHECQLMKEEEQRICETPLEPGVISRHVTTKYYKKKTVTDTTTTTSTQ